MGVTRTDSSVAAGKRVIPGSVIHYTSASVWHRSLGKPVQTRRFRLDLWSPTGDASKQGEQHTGGPLTSSAALGYTGYLRCTLTSSVTFCRYRRLYGVLFAGGTAVGRLACVR